MESHAQSPADRPVSDPHAPEPLVRGTGEQAPHPIERVADYPRPPRLEPCALPVRVEALGRVLAEGDRSLRVLETFHPPTLYLPPEAMHLAMLQPAPGHSFCEWKGVARYFDVVLPEGEPSPLNPRLRRLVRAVWQYPEPAPAFAALAGWYAVYPALMDGCWLDGERVIPQPGGFYGGWITSWVQGPFKGDPGHPQLV
ncbi:DUF427 domain-containing protein [Synechococcus sp. CBW1004]|jgi:uncharacterized protein (DUF427 family)|nr:DUF427 domain-containing protein [Synechococcus sp. CBW1004]